MVLNVFVCFETSWIANFFGGTDGLWASFSGRIEKITFLTMWSQRCSSSVSTTTTINAIINDKTKGPFNDYKTQLLGMECPFIWYAVISGQPLNTKGSHSCWISSSVRALSDVSSLRLWNVTRLSRHSKIICDK